jgi:S-adenosylmethionine decarboxylase proenzyme
VWGRTLLADVVNCENELLDQAARLESICWEAARASATPIKTLVHEYEPYGISIIVLLEESHLSLHTWPEKNGYTVDIFTCSLEAGKEPTKAFHIIKSKLGGSVRSIQLFDRGGV